MHTYSSARRLQAVPVILVRPSQKLFIMPATATPGIVCGASGWGRLGATFLSPLMIVAMLARCSGVVAERMAGSILVSSSMTWWRTSVMMVWRVARYDREW